MCSCEKLHGHLLVHVNLVECFAELLEGDDHVAVLVEFGNGALGYRVHLLLGNVGADEYAQNAEQLGLADLLVAIAVVDGEQEAQLILLAVRLARIGLAASERGEHLDELAKVELAVLAVVVDEHLDDAIAQRVDVQLGNAQKVGATQRARVVLVQAGEAVVEALDLIGREARLAANRVDLVALQ